jgi:WD40 repeat protein
MNSSSVPINIVIDIHRHDQNINHFYRAITWPLGLFLSSCFESRQLICYVHKTTTYHDFKDFHITESRGDTFFLGSLILGFCDEIVYDYKSLHYLITGSSNYYLVKDPHDNIEDWYPKSDVHTKIYPAIRRGAMKLLGITTFPSPQSISMLVYTREEQDVWRQCRLMNGSSIANMLRHHLPDVRITVINSLTDNRNHLHIFKTFASSNIVLTLHGGWAPNLVFMPPQSLVLSISNDDQYTEWDAPMNSTVVEIMSVDTPQACISSTRGRTSNQCVFCRHLIHNCGENPNVFLNCTHAISAAVNRFLKRSKRKKVV